ncbi:tRNA (adenosine(37)-N6)-dimethylallyltransferase MiaA [Nitratidesulfovibrio liaohensis]|uniref:tRNA (adenosine(37)-N6)-dimethylallyltransferase MiaA n=1 Tax=Nitratidesulfovibrio liaohensis TaxID=2604158 RepID=UPI0038CD2A1C
MTEHSATHSVGETAPPIRVICLVGPTGAGKTAAALHLARTFRGGVVNADSRQVYRDFPIITAQPSPEERAVCPHLLYGFLACTEKISAGVWTDRAAASIDALHGDRLLPLLVGGTGLYLKTLLDGIADIPRVDPAIGARLERECDALGAPALHARLADIDPDYAARIHPNDRQRAVRALEVHEGTGHTLSWWHARPVPPPRYVALRIGMDMSLDELTPRLDRRIDMMLEAGALDEARAARTMCDDPAVPGWSGIGCAELYRYLTGELPRAEARQLWLRNTRAYAKRQLTWFRADKRIHWIRPDALDAMAALAGAFLHGEAAE